MPLDMSDDAERDNRLEHMQQLLLERAARRQEDAALAEARRQHLAQRAEALRTHTTPPSIATHAAAGGAGGASAAASGSVNRSLFTWNPPAMTAPVAAEPGATRSEKASSAWSWVNR